MLRQLMRMLHRNPAEPASKNIAKNRLQLILVQDRVGTNEEIMKDLQLKLTELLAQYFEFPTDGIEMELQRERGSMALTANIPVNALKRRATDK